jgi:hypothetical protein
MLEASCRGPDFRNRSARPRLTSRPHAHAPYRDARSHRDVASLTRRPQRPRPPTRQSPDTLGRAVDREVNLLIEGGYTMRASPNYSRRRFLHAGTAGVAATVVAAATPVRAAAEAGIQAPPPTATAPRILRKPPERIAKSYNLNLSRDDLTSFRNPMDGVLASYRRLDQFAEPTLAVKYPRDAGSVHPLRTIGSTVLDQRRNVRSSHGQENCHQRQRQCVRRRHPDDERFQRAGRLRPGRGRDHCDPHPRCRWRDRRQSRV